MLKVMIVEDNVSFREIFKDWLLTQTPSIELIEAGSGEEALKKIDSYAVDLIFMDIHLPGESGLAITKKIRAGWQDVPVNIITSYDIPEYREAAIEYGASSFIAKESLKWDQISAMVKCFQRAKDSIGLKPSCVRLVSGGRSKKGGSHGSKEGSKKGFEKGYKEGC
jgi:DNA-binding NarL/FixJ family response regulator